MSYNSSDFYSVLRDGVFKRQFDAFEDRLEEESKNGWYLDWKAYSDEFIREKFKNSDLDFVDYYQTNVDSIEKDLLSRFPDRKLMIEEGFYCHRNKLFFSSSLVFCSLADGIAGGHIYHAKSKELSKRFSYPGITKMLLRALSENSAIRKSYCKGGNNQQIMNRHAVMHGNNYRFGTEINSLKSLSFFSFISWICRYED